MGHGRSIRNSSSLLAAILVLISGSLGQQRGSTATTAAGTASLGVIFAPVLAAGCICLFPISDAKPFRPRWSEPPAGGGSGKEEGKGSAAEGADATRPTSEGKGSSGGSRKGDGLGGGGGGGGGGSHRTDDGRHACGSNEADAVSGRCEGVTGKIRDKGLHAEVEVAVPFPPRNSGSITLPYGTPRSNGVRHGKLEHDIDAAHTSLHVPPGAVLEHGVPLGMTIITRTGDGKVAHSPNVQFSISVRDTGDAHNGQIFDLGNGTYYIYSTVFYSPAVNGESASVEVLLKGKHVRGSPTKVPIKMDAEKSDYSSRVASAREAGDSGDACRGGDFVLVSGSNAAMFDRLVNLVGSMHVWAKGTPVIVYDLGLSPAMVEDVLTWEDVEYRRFPFEAYPPHVGWMGENGSYAWRGPILGNVTSEHECSLWLDAGLELRSGISEIVGHIETDGHFYVTNGWPSPNRFTHSGPMKALGVSEADFYAGEGGRRMEIEACGGIQGYKRGSTMQTQVLPVYEACLLDPSCSIPQGASKQNYRQDQTVLNVALAKYRRGLSHSSPEYLASMAHTARRYWEHPIPKHSFPERSDGTFRACERGKSFQGGECVPCVEVGEGEGGEGEVLCEDEEELYAEMPGARYAQDLCIFIRRAFYPRLYEESLRYRLVGSI